MRRRQFGGGNSNDIFTSLGTLPAGGLAKLGGLEGAGFQAWAEEWGEAEGGQQDAGHDEQAEVETLGEFLELPGDGGSDEAAHEVAEGVDEGDAGGRGGAAEESVSQRASAGRSTSTNQVTTPKTMVGMPSSRKSHCQPARPSALTPSNKPAMGEPMTPARAVEVRNHASARARA